ncbi:MAG TPA: hypothetical protein ENG63_01245 [Candidatus Desulfofervidus auxilii]|uniref:Lipoprotein n=1 Tax=Desulfofervidus auxilii TaxID=1621989 RepID=A0A7C0U1H5_DESA2|nr:hypothetical protein [Thermodesulfobacteriota bacterium]MCU4138186.1 hypothetical protein [Thermodesulfobacteriota bacterium]HDD43476.1 hypothetical protein [Candidatus Desulfofervidus auxilii]
MKSKRFFRKHIGLLFILIFFISGCVDFEEKVQINPDGSGTLMIKVITDPIFANELKKEKFLEIPGKKVSIENILEGEKFYHIESVYFKNLRELKMKDETIKIRVTKKGLIGLGKTEAIFEHSIYIAKNHKTLEEEDALEEMMLIGHYFVYIVELPGCIHKADLNINGIKVKPEIRKNKVIWRIPLDLLGESSRMIFLIKFRGKFNFPSDIQSTQEFSR